MTLARNCRRLAATALVVGTLSAAATAQYTLYGAGCPGTAGTPALSNTGQPRIGTVMSVDLSSAPGTTAAVLLFSAASAAIPLGGLGAPGCQLLVAPGGPSVASPTSAGGTASVPVGIPPMPALVGAVFFNQWGVLDPGANPLGITTSNGGRAQILDRLPIALTSVSVLDPAVGQIISVVGSNFGNDPDDLCFRIALPGGDLVLLRALSVSATPGGDVARVLMETPPLTAAAGPLMVMRGSGGQSPKMATPRLSAPGENPWVWNGTGAAGNTAATPFNLMPKPITSSKKVLVPVTTSGNCIIIDLPPDPCGTGLYPQDAKLTTDIHMNYICGGHSNSDHYDFFMKEVTVIPALGVACQQVAVEHSTQIQAALDAKYGAGVFNVTFDIAGGKCRIIVKLADQNCQLTSAGGKVVICCP